MTLALATTTLLTWVLLGVLGFVLFCGALILVFEFLDWRVRRKNGVGKTGRSTPTKIRPEYDDGCWF